MVRQPGEGADLSSRNIVRNVRDTETKEFVRALESLSRTRHRWDVFRDWTEMAACTLYNILFHDQKIEAEYLACVGRYEPDEARTMAEMLGMVLSALSTGPRDFMGEVFSGSLLMNENHGQFFTPYELSLTMARMVITEDSIPRGKIISISEPSCGAGGMVIAAATVLEELGVNCAADVYFEARDLDPICARMAYIQMTALGLSGEVICGNTLTLEESWRWPTAAYLFNVVGPRLAAQRQREIEEGAAPRAPLKIGPQIGLFEEVSA